MLKVKVLNAVVDFDLDNGGLSTDSADVFFKLTNVLGESVLTGAGEVDANIDSVSGALAMCYDVDKDFEIINPSDEESLQYRLLTEGDVLIDE